MTTKSELAYVWTCVAGEHVVVTDGDPIDEPEVCDRLAPHDVGCKWDLRDSWCEIHEQGWLEEPT